MKTLRRCIFLLAAILMTGCLSKPHLARQSFTFAIPPAAENSATSGLELGVRRITVSSPFDSQSFTYWIGEFYYERDPYLNFSAHREKF